MSETSPQLSIIIVTHNSAGVLEQCLEALNRAAAEYDGELIIVDNASKDTTLDVARSLWATVRIVEKDRNQGFATACNTGAALASGKYLLFLNPDVIIDTGAISALIAEIEAEEKAGLVSGRLRFPDGHFQATCRNLPTIGNILFSRGAVTSGLTSRRGGTRYTLPDYEQTTTVPAVAATMVMISRELFERFGGFDSRFFMYLEDTDLSTRLQLAGHHNLFVPAAGGVHLWGRGSSTGRIKRLWHHHMSVWRYFLKHIPNGFSVIVLPALLVINFVVRVLIPARSKGEAK